METEKIKLQDAEESTGAFLRSLKRNNRQIREDRADSISEDTELAYKRKVEDIAVSIKRMMRERENLLDLSPKEATSLILASDFNSNNFVTDHHRLGVMIRNANIELEIARTDYENLFGKKI